MRGFGVVFAGAAADWKDLDYLDRAWLGSGFLLDGSFVIGWCWWLVVVEVGDGFGFYYNRCVGILIEVEPVAGDSSS